MPEQTPATMPEPWLSPRDAANYLGVTVRTIRRYRAAGILPPNRIGRRVVRYRRADLDSLFRGE